MVEVAPVAGQAMDADHRARSARAAPVGVAQAIAPVGALDVDAADLHHGSSTAGAAGGASAGARLAMSRLSVNRKRPHAAGASDRGATHLTRGGARRSLARCPARDPSPLPAASAELSDADGRAEPADVVHPGADGGGDRRLRARAAAGGADRARHPRPAAAAVPARAAARRRGCGARTGRDPERLLEPGSDRRVRAAGGRRGHGQYRRARRHRAPAGLAGARQLSARGDLQPGLCGRQQRVSQQHTDRGDLHADPALDRGALRPHGLRRDDAFELRRDSRRHADADRHLDQPSGLGRAREVGRAAARFLRLHRARPGARALRRGLRPAPADAAAATGRPVRPGRGGRQAVHRRARRRAGFAADRRERTGRHVPEPGRGHGAPRRSAASTRSCRRSRASRCRPATF